MGVEHYIVCSTHQEKFWMGKLQFLDSWVRKLIEAKNIRLVRTPTPLQHVRTEVRKFRERHNTDECVLELINDHADDFLEPEFVYYRKPIYSDPLPTKEQLEEYVKNKEQELLKEDARHCEIPLEFRGSLEG